MSVAMNQVYLLCINGLLTRGAQSRYMIHFAILVNAELLRVN